MKGMRRSMEERLEGGLRGGILPYCSATTGAMLKVFQGCPLTAQNRDGKSRGSFFLSTESFVPSPVETTMMMTMPRIMTTMTTMTTIMTMTMIMIMTMTPNMTMTMTF